MTRSQAKQGELPFTVKKIATLSVDQLWELADADLLSKAAEDRRVERKPPAVRSDYLAEYYSMWANTATEGGVMAIGVADDGKILGCGSIELQHINKLESEAHTRCPDAHVQPRRILVKRSSDGCDDFVLFLRVHYNQNRVVHTTRGDAFIRRGESKHRLTHHEIRDLQNDKGEVRVEQELYPSFKFPRDFRPALVREFVTNVRANLNERHTDEEVLAIRRLGEFKSGRFVPNGACVLLFAQDPILKFPGAQVRFLRFEGEVEGSGESWNAVKDIMIEGPVPHLIQQTERALDEQLRTFSRLGEDQKFSPVSEYPKQAWYEALVNACVHRSWGTLKNIPIFVKMFDNRLEILSPGPFPPSVTPENIYGNHSPRNPFLMNALLFMNIVKCAAEGTRRMLRVMQEADLPEPEFRQKSDDHPVVGVTLRNKVRERRAWIVSAASAVLPHEVNKTLSDEERHLINYVAENKTINTTEAMRLTERGWKSAHRVLQKLASRGILKYHHRNDIVRDRDAHFTLARLRREAPHSTVKG